MWYELDRQMPTYNGRFGTMAGVTPLNISCELGR